MKQKYFFFNFWARQGLTLVLRILTKKIRNQGYVVLKKIFEKQMRKRFDFFLEVNLTRTDLAPTYLMVENQGSRSSIQGLFV